MSVDIIIPVHNQLNDLIKCVESVRRNTENYRIIVVNDASNAETSGWINRQPDLKVIANNTILGFGRSCNLGILEFLDGITGHACFLNSDTVVTKGWLNVMLGVAVQGIDIVGPTTSHSNGIQCDHSIARIRDKYTTRQMEEMADYRHRRYGTNFQETDVFGFCLLVSRRALEAVGGFDWVLYQDGYYEDWDLVWRAQQLGFKSAWAKGAYVHHYGAKSFVDRIGWARIKQLSDRNERIFNRRKSDTCSLYFNPGVNTHECVPG